MAENNKAEYIPTKFIMDLSEIDWDKNNHITDETFPMYAHEYCHYIQDVSTISAISGFYYKMVDVVELTKITCDGIGKKINIPIQKDLKGYSIDKNKKLYSYYCGHVISFNNQFDFDKTAKETTKISLGGENINIPIFKLDSQGHQNVLVGTYALQESQAYYIQKIIELEILKNKKNICFKISADSLPKYPYKFVDYLFDSFQINVPIEMKSFLVDLCLDSILPLVTIIKVLELIKKESNNIDFIEINRIYLEAVNLLCLPMSNYLQSYFKSFFEDIASDINRDYFKKGVSWYLETIDTMRNLRNKSPYLINGVFSDINHVKGFMIANRSPVVFKNNDIVFFKYDNEDESVGQEILDSATILFLYAHIFALLTEKDLENFNKLVCCPLYYNCQLRKDMNSDYVCKTNPWTIPNYHKDKNKSCYYRKALIELGLEQNEIIVNFSI